MPSNVLDLMQRQGVEAFADKSVRDVCEDAAYLRSMHATREADKSRIQRIINGGSDGLRALLGPGMANQDLYAGNFILSGIESFARKFANGVPDLAVPVPVTKDSEPSRQRAEKLERIVRAYDEEGDLRLGVPHAIRWMAGYGFCPWVVSESTSVDGYRYPTAKVRDPFNAYPSKWGPQEQPDRIAFWHSVDLHQLRKLYSNIDAHMFPNGAPKNAAETKVDVVEYIDASGTWWVIPGRDILLDFAPNPVSRAPFAIMSRFAFDKVVGKYDQAVGLLVAMAKMNTLALIAMEDAVFSETIVSGELAQGNTWHKGRNAINYTTQGTTVQKLQQNLPYQMFQEIDRLERQLRIVSGYSVIDDSQSPNSFVTGRGLNELTSSADNEVREYQLALGKTIERLDWLRLEWDEAVDADTTKPLPVYRDGQFNIETYRPSTHIRRNYRTKRKFGVMAGFDDSQKIVTGLQLLQAEIIDHRTLREAIDGLDNATEIEQRIRETRAERLANQFLEARAGQGDAAAVVAVIEQMAEGPLKETMKRLFTPEDPEPSPAEQQAGIGPAAEPAGPESAQTVLARLMDGGQATLGAQTVGQF